ncbi:hypothetical protein SGLAU_33015 (plasmid) [Streptomyces glaucescens]|uniref:Uncharacterized protein n=1 Tax=Streptomyces glaucescens TaxID=1907 RepID=A0A089XEX7_STRGA|nr:hypothetical protein SGLAU_33015 [Streptomyces glaucescens]
MKFHESTNRDPHIRISGLNSLVEGIDCRRASLGQDQQDIPTPVLGDGKKLLGCMGHSLTEVRMREATQGCMRRLVSPVILLSLQGRDDRSDTGWAFVASNRISQLDISIPATLSLAGRSHLIIILHEVTTLDDLNFPVRRHSNLTSFCAASRDFADSGPIPEGPYFD